MANCTKKVGRGVLVYPCTVEIPAGKTEHEGPCEAVEVPSSQASRRRWESGADARAILGATQANPVTFSSMEGATPVPGTHLMPAEHRQVHRPKLGDFGAYPAPVEDCPHPYAAIQHADDGTIVCMACGLAVARSTPPEAEVKAEAPDRPAPFEGLRDFVETHQAPPSQDAVDQGVVVEVESRPPLNIPRLGIREQPTKQREGDQRLPTEGNPRPAVQDIIIDMAQESKRVGTERYGQPLKPLNGRDTFRDLTEEARDFFVYSTCLMMERDEILVRAERLWSLIEAFPPEATEDLRAVILWLRGTPTTSWGPGDLHRG